METSEFTPNRQSESSRQDFNLLLEPCLSLAKRLLSKFGEFLPFGHAMRANGEIESFAFDAGPDKTGRERVDYGLIAFREVAKTRGLRATALCFDVRVVPPGESDKSDAIEIQMEHIDGAALSVFLPYQRDSSGMFIYGTLFAAKAESMVFARVM
jgi:hypothetical protein